MKNELPVEEQVALLTEAQKEKIIKVGKIVNIFSLIGLVLACILCVFTFATIFAPPVWYDYKTHGVGVVVAALIGIGYFLVVMAVAKKVCPDYSEARWKYIMKMKREEKK